MKKGTRRICINVIVFSLVFMHCNIHTFASNETLNTTAVEYEWSEEQNSMGNNLKNINNISLSYVPTWVLTDNSDINVTSGKINLKSYVMTFLNGTKLCKGVSTHSKSFYGYVRARFESLFGVVVSGSDSDRKYSYYGSTAQTPDDTQGNVGWNGTAHTYCGTD